MTDIQLNKFPNVIIHNSSPKIWHPCQHIFLPVLSNAMFLPHPSIKKHLEITGRKWCWAYICIYIAWVPDVNWIWRFLKLRDAWVTRLPNMPMHGYENNKCMTMNLHKCPRTFHATESKYKMRHLNPFHGGLLKPSSSNIRSLVQSCLCLHVTNLWCETDGYRLY